MSEKSVAERLQIKADRLLAVVGATPELDAAAGALDRRTEPANADVVLLFVRDLADLKGILGGVTRELRPTSLVWVSYPKLSSRLAGDLNRDLIRGLASNFGFNVVSQIAVDDDWSALRLKASGADLPQTCIRAER